MYDSNCMTCVLFVLSFLQCEVFKSKNPAGLLMDSGGCNAAC